MARRARAILLLDDGVPVSEVAARFAVSRQSVHAWLARYLPARRVDSLAGRRARAAAASS